MSALPKLPPSGRDLLTYQRVVVDGASTRVVAEEVGVSQTRVRQVVQRVMEWLVETLPADDELSDAARLRLGQHIAADRLEHFYAQASRSWHETTEIKFANLCLRIILAQAKFPALPGAIEALAFDAIHGPLPDNFHLVPEDFLTTPPTPITPPAQPLDVCQPAVPVPEPKMGGQNNHRGHGSDLESQLPPVRDCSVAAPISALPLAHQRSATAVTPPAPVACDKLPPPQQAARNAFLSPAHLPIASAADAQVTEFKITPNTLGFTTKQVPSRKERRRWQRNGNTP